MGYPNSYPHREYQTGNGGVYKNKGRGRWQGRIRYRVVAEDGEGNVSKGPWKTVSKLFDVACYESGNRGKKTAERACAEWKRELEEAEPERARLEAVEAAAERGDIPITPRSTVAELLEFHIEDHARAAGTERSTISKNRADAKRICDGGTRMDSGIGDVRICDLGRTRVEKLRNDMQDAYCGDVVVRSLCLLKAALDDAVERGAIESNPAEGVKTPGSKSKPPAYLESSERYRLLQDLDRCIGLGRKGYENALAAKISLLTGLRESEICALRWENVDFGRKVIKVREAIGHDNGHPYLKGTKSSSTAQDASRRDVHIPEELAPDLRARRERMESEAREAGGGWSDSLFVLGSIDGDYRKPGTVRRSWETRTRRLQLVDNEGEMCSFHTLRHTFATVMAHSGMYETKLCEVMGHTNLNTTKKYYIGLTGDGAADAVEAVAAAMYREPEEAAFLEELARR